MKADESLLESSGFPVNSKRLPARNDFQASRFFFGRSKSQLMPQVVKESVKIFAVVGGDTIPMVKDPVNPFLWSCDSFLE